MADTTQASAYQEALRGVVQQQDVLKDIRGRASTLLGVASISTSFLGGLALQEHKPHGLGWLAVGAFVLIGGLTLLMLLPQQGWVFRFSAKRLIGDYVEAKPPADLPDMQRDLALHLENHYIANDKRLGRLFWLFRLASTILVVEIVTWLLVLSR
jgi:hypothetical protein